MVADDSCGDAGRTFVPAAPHDRKEPIPFAPRPRSTVAHRLEFSTSVDSSNRCRTIRMVPDTLSGWSRATYGGEALPVKGTSITKGTHPCIPHRYRRHTASLSLPLSRTCSLRSKASPGITSQGQLNLPARENGNRRHEAGILDDPFRKYTFHGGTPCIDSSYRVQRGAAANG